MDITIAGIVLVSAALHPFRDLMVKKNMFPESAYFACISLWVVFAAVHSVILGFDLWSAAAVWPLVLFSCLGVFLYYMGTMETIKRGDVSVYYPILRSSPLPVVVVGFLALGHRYSLTMLGGIALVLIGAFFLQYKRGTRLFSQPLVMSTALVALAGTGVYSLADAEAMRTVEPMVFLFWVNVLVVLCSAIYIMVMKSPGRSHLTHLFGGWRQTPVMYVMAGLSSYASYYLILTAFQMGGNVAAVTSVRQVSIPLAVILGGLYLKEADTRSRLLWAVVLAAGVVVIVLAR